GKQSRGLLKQGLGFVRLCPLISDARSCQRSGEVKQRIGVRRIQSDRLPKPPLGFAEVTTEELSVPLEKEVGSGLARLRKTSCLPKQIRFPDSCIRCGPLIRQGGECP